METTVSPASLALLPAKVPTNYDLADRVLQAELDQELTDMMEIVLDPEIALLTFALGLVFVELLVDGLQDATVDQYGRRLV